MTERTLCVLMLVVLGVTACNDNEPSDESKPRSPGLTGIRYLAADSGSNDGFARATEPRAFRFPSDHGPHPGYRNEWWYFTGNVFDADGQHYGFELTLISLAAGAGSPARESTLASNQIWMGNLAITDTRRRKFQAAERLSRGAAELAGTRTGATAQPQSIVIAVEDWSVSYDDQTVSIAAEDADFGLDLRLAGLDRIVLQGEGGLDRKGPEPGNASYYYSAPRLSVTGQLRSAGGAPVDVTGSAWMDREWSTSALSSGVAGWDWFALQFDDGADLMFYRLRTDDGGTSEFSGGTLTAANGSVTVLDAGSVALEATRYWQSARSGVRYPVSWILAIPTAGIELAISPALDDQEIDLTVRYWEGAVSVTGSRGGARIGGVGYLELAGY